MGVRTLGGVSIHRGLIAREKKNNNGERTIRDEGRTE